MAKRRAVRLYSARDIAIRCGVSINTVRKWPKRYPSFPEPVDVISGYTRVWDADAVDAWFAKRGGRLGAFGRAVPAA